MFTASQEPTYTDLRHAGAVRLEPREGVLTDDARVPTRATSQVVRAAAIVLLILFFLPWGSVWISTECASRSDQNTVGTISGWEIANGKEFSAERDPGVRSGTVSIDPQRDAFIVPFIALTILAVSMLARSGTSKQRAGGMIFYYLLALFGSIMCWMVAHNVTSEITEVSGQGVMPGTNYTASTVSFDPGGVFALLFLTLSILGICGIIGLTLLTRDAARTEAYPQDEADAAWLKAQSNRSLSPLVHTRAHPNA